MPPRLESAPRRRPRRRSSTGAPVTDVQSGGGYKTHRGDHHPQVHRALADVFEAQTPKMQQHIVRVAENHPEHPTSRAILRHVARRAKTPHPADIGHGRDMAKARAYARREPVQFIGRHGGVVLDMAAARKKGAFGTESVLSRKADVVAGAIAKPTRRVVEDYIDIEANAIPSMYYLGKTAATGHLGKAGKMLLQPYIEAAKHPIESFKEHPVGTALLFAGPKSVAGRGAGRAMRLAPEGSRVQRIARTERAAKSATGTTLEHERAYSPDVITKAGQVAHERVQRQRIQRLVAKAQQATKEGKGDRADELLVEARGMDPSRMSSHEIRKRVDARVDANEVIRRQNRARITKQVDEILPRHGKEAVPLVAQNITRADPRDLAAYRAEIEAAKINRPARQRVNKNLRQQIKTAEGAKDMKAVEQAARDYRDVIAPLREKLVDAGLLGKKEAEMSPLVPYAIRHMDAKFVKEHYRDASGKKLSKAEVRAIRETRTPAAADAALQKVSGRLVDASGERLTPTAIRAHMQAHGFDEPAYVTQAPGQRGGRNYFVSQHEAPSNRMRQRTGEATRKGTFDAHPDVLREGAARMQGLVDAHEGYAKFVGEFSRRGNDKQVRTYNSYDNAIEHARDLVEETGMEWTPIRLKPFAGRREQLESLIDHTHPDNQMAMNEVTKALEDAVEATSGAGPWALVPRSAAHQMSQHIRVMGAGSGGKAVQAVSGAFRKTVLATNPKWLFGNVAEAGLRAAIARAGPRSLITGQRVMAKLEKTDPEAAQELRARALGGGHFAMADRMPSRRAEQFKDTRLEGIANGLAAFWSTPGPREVARVWRGWTNLVFHRINQPAEATFQTAMLGREVRRTLMPRQTVKIAGDAVDQAARGMRNTNTQARLAEAVDRMYGQYSKFSPAHRRWIALYTPFLAWSLNALRFATQVLPRDHPALLSAIASAHQVSEEWRKTHGLAKFMEGAAPGFLQGSIPVGDSKLRVSRFTPFGAFADPADTAAGLILPQYSGVLSALKGEDWKGTKLRDAKGNELDDIGKANEAAKAFALATIPLFGQASRAAGNEGGLLAGLRQEVDPLKPVPPPKKKRKGSSFDFNTAGGGASSSPSQFDFGSAK